MKYIMLPESIQEIADVIGREAALYLVGQLPTCRAGAQGKRATRVILYVPKRLKPNHRLVQILGWERANKLVEGFGGEILQPANCQEVYRRFRDREAQRLFDGGASIPDLAAIFSVTERHIRNLTRAALGGLPAAAND
ncbi:hypothetical protein [Novosphingobium sp. KN65.2]|uniref:hypothetical protein n=1 Tax=Novosphingobium sp. KN65.2 TaxID=1478134 RepID=UPI0006D53DD3|nr:hypothetical protein [Novosphingobium sp. KN65.2]